MSRQSNPPYYRRNAQALHHLSKAGFRAEHADFSGGYEGVHVPLEGGYGLEIGQDMDHPQLPWHMRVRGPDGEGVSGVDRGQPADIELGDLHPRQLPDAIKGAHQPVSQMIRSDMIKNRGLNAREFGE